MTTPNLELPELTQNQTQPHVPVNSALRRLDVAAQLIALSLSVTAPPGSPAAGDVYIVPPGATGAWTGHDNDVAFYNSGWQFLTPKTGWLAFVISEGTRYEFIDGSPAAWEVYNPGGGISGVIVADSGVSPPTSVEEVQSLTFVGATVTETAPGEVEIEFVLPEIPEVGVPGGAASLDGGGKVPTSQLPSTVLGSVEYQGTWNANTNSPDLGASSPSKGDYFVVSTAGSTSLGGISDWAVGDWAIYNGSAWEKVDNSEAVTSVAGRTGAVVLGTTDIVGVATARILGRTTAGSGAAEELTAAQVYAMLKSQIPVDYQVAMSDNTTPIAAGTGVAYMRAPRAFTLTDVRASLLAVSTSGAVQVDVNVNGASVLSTKLTIDANEKTSTTAATPAVISSPNIADDDEITFDIDSEGVGAKGLVVTLKGTLA